ncbi:type VI secretion system lipoprotein TssJ, partial [Helicobacter rodentium]|uniref:type VI secretion system lipoprotein TssJ n=1 Tax=Helicobacter rodentium TaxID=59617 RepID=UPI0025B79CC6
MFYRHILFFLVILVFFACSSSKVDIKINNHEKSNLNNRQDDVPLTIIVYQLKDIKKFEQANDIDLFSRGDVVLGKDKIDSIKMQIAPK